MSSGKIWVQTFLQRLSSDGTSRQCLSTEVTRQMSVNVFINKVELQWLEQAWDHGNWFQPRVVPAIQGGLCL